MSDLISRQAVIQMLNTADRYVANSLRLCDTDKTFPQNEVFIVDDMYEGLEQLPSAQPERKTGRWIYHDDDDMRFDTYHCSVCRKMFTVDAERFDDIGFVKEDLKYCPNCGARMEEDNVRKPD